MIDVVNSGKLRVKFVANACFNENVVLARLDEQAGEPKAYTVALISGRLLFPQNLGNNPKHLSPVETEHTVGQRVNLKSAQLHHLPPCSGYEVSRLGSVSSSSSIRMFTVLEG